MISQVFKLNFICGLAFFFILQVLCAGSVTAHMSFLMVQIMITLIIFIYIYIYKIYT